MGPDSDVKFLTNPHYMSKGKLGRNREHTAKEFGLRRVKNSGEYYF